MSVWIDPDVRRLLQKYVVERGGGLRKQSEIVEEAIREYLEKRIDCEIVLFFSASRVVDEVLRSTFQCYEN